uniref:outer membrane lipoprotein-sorting protein n=1 Tax=Thaumasiovibrio occultus TaxID=1891184 RepID=UPI000B361728|nr:outer membrane lipoprotein-sorting protein [Thaumasiovibrio occultus]
MISTTTLRTFIGAVTMAVISVSASADISESAERGLAIAQERKARDEGWGDSVAQLSMELRNPQGEVSTRELRISTLEVDGDGDKGLTIFDQPRDIQGSAFLNHSHVEGADDQWLYLPALRRVKRIASQNKSGPFMGSEFAYEDLSSFEIEKYTFRFVGEESLNGSETFVVEQIPHDEFSGYTRQVVWLDQQHYRALKIEFYDRKDALLKTLVFSDYQLYQDQFWRAHTMVMENHQTGKSTTLLTHELTFGTGLTDADFRQETLSRAR